MTEDRGHEERSRLPAWALALAAGTLFTVIGLGAVTWEARPLAYVGQITISRHAFREACERESLRASEIAMEGVPGEIERQVARELIDREVMVQVAIAHGFTVSDDDLQARVQAVMAQFPDAETARRSLATTGTRPEDLEAQLRRDLLVDRLEQEEVRRVLPSIEVLRQRYTGQRARFIHPERVHARHILLPGTPSGRRTARTLVRDLASGMPFELLAHQHSQDVTTRDSAGDLGFFERGRMLPAFERAAFTARPGQVVGPVETRFGYHVIEVLAHEKSRIEPFEAVLPRLRSELGAEVRRRAVERARTAWRQEVPIRMGPGYGSLDPRLEEPREQEGQ